MDTKMVPLDSIRDADRYVFEGHGPRALVLRQFAENANFFDPDPELLAQRVRKVAEVFDLSQYLDYDQAGHEFDGLRHAMDYIVEDKSRQISGAVFGQMDRVDVNGDTFRRSWTLAASVLDGRITGSARSYGNERTENLFQISHVKESYICSKPYPYIKLLRDRYLELMHLWLGSYGVNTDHTTPLDLTEFKQAVMEMVAHLDIPRVRLYVDQAILKHNNPAARARIKTPAFFMDVYKSDEGLYYGLLHTTSIVNRYRYRAEGEICLAAIINLSSGVFLTEPEYAIEMIRDNPMPWKNDHVQHYYCVTRLWMPDWIERLKSCLEPGKGIVGTMNVDLLAPSILRGLSK